MSKNSYEISKIKNSKIIKNDVTKIKYDDVTKIKYDDVTKIGRDDRGNQGRRRQQDNAMQCRQMRFRSANKASNALNNNKPQRDYDKVSRLLI